MTIVHPAICLLLYLTGIHFRGELQHGGDVSQQKIKCRSIRTQEIGGISLSDVLYVSAYITLKKKKCENKSKVNTSLVCCFFLFLYSKEKRKTFFCKISRNNQN